MARCLLTAAQNDASVRVSVEEFLGIRCGGGGMMGGFLMLFRNPLVSHNVRGMLLKRFFRKSHCQSALQKNLVMKRVFTHGIKEPVAKQKPVPLAFPTEAYHPLVTCHPLGSSVSASQAFPTPPPPPPGVCTVKQAQPSAGCVHVLV